MQSLFAFIFGTDCFEKEETKKNIRISEKYGVNPTIPICFWCGREKNEIALLGKLPGDAEAPKSTWLVGDYEPCDACKELRGQGIDLIEVADHPIAHPKQLPWHGAYPTGRHVILSEHGIRAIFSVDVADDLCKRRIGFLDRETFINLQNLLEKE